MKKCCSKTLLNEWKTFLKENKEFTKNIYEEGQKVKVEICCNGCGKAVTPKKNYIKKGVVFFGIVKENTGPKNVTFSGEEEQEPTKVNMIEVDCDGEIFSFPQCCVNLGVKSQKGSNETPDHIKNGNSFLYKGKECVIKQNDIGGTLVLITVGEKDKSVDYNSLYELGEKNE